MRHGEDREVTILTERWNGYNRETHLVQWYINLTTEATRRRSKILTWPSNHVDHTIICNQHLPKPSPLLANGGHSSFENPGYENGEGKPTQYWLTVESYTYIYIYIPLSCRLLWKKVARTILIWPSMSKHEGGKSNRNWLVEYDCSINTSLQTASHRKPRILRGIENCHTSLLGN